jgi:hypothetical protein
MSLFLTGWATQPLVVEDPVNLTNNLGRSCFRINQILQSFNDVGEFLRMVTMQMGRTKLKKRSSAEENLGSGTGSCHGTQKTEVDMLNGILEIALRRNTRV